MVSMNRRLVLLTAVIASIVGAVGSSPVFAQAGAKPMTVRLQDFGPTPIAMPGLAALNAALHPAASKALYFVARGDGSSKFSDSLVEHERAVTKYQRRGNH